MRRTKELLCIFLAFLVILFSFGVIANAETDLTKTKGSLTITKYEKGATGKEGQNTPLKGVTFSIYKVADDETSTEIGSYTLTDEKTTGDNGTVTFSNLDLGRYLVVEKSVPENVVEKIANFLVDIPRDN